MLTLENIQGGYISGCQILHGVNMNILPGEVVGIIGLNGSGKSTLGKAIINTLPFRTGRLIFKGKDISSLPIYKVQKSGISMIMQGGRIFSNMTVKEHMKLVGNTLSEIELNFRLSEIEKKFGIHLFSGGIIPNCRGSYLSGGEKLHLSFIMALLNQPKLLILDEISAGLSPRNISKMTELILKLKDEYSISIILIEQNIKFSAQISDRLLLLEKGIIDQEFIINNRFDFNELNKSIFN